MIAELIDVCRYVTAGRATFSLKSKKTGARYTYKVTKRDDSPCFVKLKCGNEYSFLGTIFESGEYRHGRRSQIDQQNVGAIGFEWFWKNLPRSLDQLEFEPSSKCCCCGRELTDEKSQAMGIGPECRKKLEIG